MDPNSLSPTSASRPPSPQRQTREETIPLGNLGKDGKRDDGFRFPPAPRNPGNDPTRPRESSSEPSKTPKDKSLDASATAVKENQDSVFAQTDNPHIFQRKHGGWYARLPDVDIGKREIKTVVNGNDEGGHSTKIQDRPTHYSGHTVKEETSTAQTLLLEWNNSKVSDNKRTLSLFDDHDCRSNQQETDTLRRVYWQFVRFRNA